MSVLEELTTNARLVLSPIHYLLAEIPEVRDAVPDIHERHIHATVLHGAYSMPSTVVVVVNGSPPKLTLVVDAYELNRRDDVVATVMSFGRVRRLKSIAALEAARQTAIVLIKHSQMQPGWQEMWFRGQERPNRLRRDGTSPATPLD